MLHRLRGMMDAHVLGYTTETDSFGGIEPESPQAAPLNTPMSKFSFQHSFHS